MKLLSISGASSQSHKDSGAARVRPPVNLPIAHAAPNGQSTPLHGPAPDRFALAWKRQYLGEVTVANPLIARVRHLEQGFERRERRSHSNGNTRSHRERGARPDLRPVTASKWPSRFPQPKITIRTIGYRRRQNLRNVKLHPSPTRPLVQQKGESARGSCIRGVPSRRRSVKRVFKKNIHLVTERGQRLLDCARGNLEHGRRLGSHGGKAPRF